MQQFRIKECNPLYHKSYIQQFWQKYLPWVPPKRIDWLANGNPAGSTKWILAFEEARDELVGLVSITPKKMYIQRDEVKAGILGDLILTRDKNR